MKWKRYPQYKDSGIEWLGEIPDDWSSLKICRIGTLRNGLNKDKSAYGTGTRYVTVNDLYEEGYIEQEKLKRMEVNFQEYNQYSLQEHDILFARSSVKREGVGNPGIIEKIQEETVFSGFVIRLRVNNEKAYKKYIYWLLRSRSIRDIVVAVSNTVAQTNLSQPNLKSIDICFPSTKEQRKIALFLERETSRIDKLIEKKENQIELLKEKRAALISHAVTKGLDPNVKMKDSGIDWLGEIPEDWEVKKIKYIFKNLDHKRIPISSEERSYMEKKYPYYGASGIIDEVESYIFDEPLILVAEDGANLLSRSTPLAFIAKGKYWVNNHAHILKPLSGVIKYWENVLLSFDYTPLISGAAQPKLTSENLGNIFLPVPNDREQHKIADYLIKETNMIDRLTKKIFENINILKEYRTAIISAAVTGKIDVRDAV
jgi:type I restriction enzyme S subunit